MHTESILQQPWLGVLLLVWLLAVAPPAAEGKAGGKGATPPGAHQQAARPQDRVKEPMNPDTQLTWNYSYDKEGRLGSIKDPGGRETSFAYQSYPEDPDRLKTLTRRHPGGDVVYEFDRRGRRSSMRDALGATGYEWDVLGQIKSIQRQGGPKIDYQYDSLGRLKRYGLGGTFAVEYDYDFLGRVDAMKTPVGAIRYEYHAGNGRVIRTLPNGIRTAWDYDPAGRLAAITHVDKKDLLIAKFTYAYRPDGLIAQVVEWSPSGEKKLSYEYDAVQRLVAVTDSTGNRWQAEYDPVGNRTRVAAGSHPPLDAGYDWSGRLTALGGEPCGHDASGNLIRVKLGGGPRHFEYGHAGRLQQANDGEVVYRYDGDGYLVARAVRGEQTTFVPDPLTDIWRPLLETTPHGRQRFYLWDGRAPLAVVEDGRAAFFLHDHLGSVRVVLDETGKVVERRDYSPFGVNSAPLGGGDLVPAFAGLFWDGNTSLYLTRGRAYSPELGRFLQIDPQHRVPFGSQKDLSVYAYCGNDPVNYVDRNGWEPEFLGSELFDMTMQNLIGAGMDWLETDSLEVLPSEWGEWGVWGNTIGHSYNVWSFWTGAIDSAQYVKDHYGEGGADWKVLSVVLDAYSLWGPGELLPKAAGGLSTLGSLAQLLGDATRSRILQNRSERLVHFGGAVLSRPYRINEDYGRRSGYFSVHGNRYWSSGGWSLRESSRGWLERNSHSQLWARSEVRGGIAPDGSRISGTFRRSERRDEYGANIFNLYEPATTIITRRAYDSYTVTRGGGYAETPSARKEAPLPSSLPLKTTVKEPPPPELDRRIVPVPNRTYPAFFFPPRRMGDFALDDQIRPPGPGGAAYRSSSLSPSPVGGVYLGGAGKLLEGLGQLKGVMVDPLTGQLVLISEQTGDIRLPSLRLDDVVTIFRSVYRHGEGPSVTINPHPADPHGPFMDVVHGAATPDTYAGWVLFEADRIMKTYNLGKDNVSKIPISTAVPGYDKVHDTIFFGGEFADGQKLGGNWERFWIVPAKVNRFQASPRELTLFDVPLKVKTQKMILKNGKLEDDPKGKSSKGALAFIDWFTGNYDGISRECYLQPPPETGLTEPVPVFSELRRIALITAIAEQLRDQGVPMPPWMKDYPVKRVPVTPTTPAMTVSDSKIKDDNIKVEASIYGGVNLSPADEVVRTFDPKSDLKGFKPEEREHHSRQVALAKALTPEVAEAARAAPILTPFTVREKERQFPAVSFPGADSRALASCRLQESDLAAAGEGGVLITLPRLFNSFFRPTDVWGEGWTMDLPRLEEVKIPVERTDKSVKFKTVFELSTPLNSLRVRFSQVARAEGELMVPDKPCAILGLADATNPLVKAGKTAILFKDGRSWLFDGQGNLVGEQAAPHTTVYLREAGGRLRQIVGYHGGQPRAGITLNYDAQGRLESALAENAAGKEEVTYRYGGDGLLTAVISAAGKVSYEYEHGLVKSLYWSDRSGDDQFGEARLERRFDYADNGRLSAETTADGHRISYGVEPQGEGSRMVIGPEGKPADGQTIRYDASLRPLEWTGGDQARIRWEYAADGAVTAEATSPGNETVRISVSGDGRHRVTKNPDGNVLQEDFDDAGRLVGVNLGERSLFKQQWHPDGLLRSVDYETCSILPRYDRQSVMTSVMRVKPAQGGKFAMWRETLLDAAGRVKAVKDYSGADSELSYAADGSLAGAAIKRDGQNYIFQVRRNAGGQVEGIQSSWGDEEYRYDGAGNLSRVTVKKGEALAVADYAEGRLKSLTHYDGGCTEYDYYKDSEPRGRLKSLQTPAVALEYRYRADGALKQVDCGNHYRVTYEFDARGNLVQLAMTPQRH